ncbi:MAG: SAP domain-containing protein, partial [Candidatus Helarchaeota archaeon]|nr:SAP domain-containing protein [Candidatus Helarchaeota archaeon]
MARKKKKEKEVVEPSEKKKPTVEFEAYDEEKGGIILKDDNKEGLIALIKVLEEVQVEQDHDANVKAIGFNGKLNVENPSSVDRLWDIGITLSNIEGTDIESEEIKIKELGITDENNVDSREFQITREAKNLLLVKEYINTSPNADDILNIRDIETDLLKLKEKTVGVEAEVLEVKEEEIEKEIEEERGIEVPEIEEEIKEEEEFIEAEIEEEIEAEEEIDYNSWTVKELKGYCEENNIKLPPSAKKAEIIETIKKWKSTEENDVSENGGVEAKEYNLESFGININQLNAVTFAIALCSLFEKSVTKVKVVKNVPLGFENIKIIDTSLGLAEIEDNKITWLIDNLEPETTVFLKFTTDIQIDTKEPVKTGIIEVSYKAESSFTGGLAIEKFNAFTNNKHYLDMIEKDEVPGLWDCNLVFENPSEFFIELIDIDVHAPEAPDT